MNFNEQMNTLLYKSISLTLYSRKGWCWLCVRDELETEADCYFDPAVLLSHLGLVAQPWVTEGPKPSVCRWLSIRHLVPDWLQLAQTASGTWLYNCLTPTCFRWTWNGYSTLLLSPELRPHHQMQFCVIVRTALFWEGVFSGDTVRVS